MYVLYNVCTLHFKVAIRWLTQYKQVENRFLLWETWESESNDSKYFSCGVYILLVCIFLCVTFHMNAFIHSFMMLVRSFYEDECWMCINIIIIHKNVMFFCHVNVSSYYFGVIFTWIIQCINEFHLLNGLHLSEYQLNIRIHLINCNLLMNTLIQFKFGLDLV